MDRAVNAVTANVGRVGPTYHDSVPSWPEPTRPPKGAPNVVFIVFDDVGFSDFGCYGGDIDTPVIDALAAGGVRLTNFHTTAICSPTRACLLTGKNHHAVGMGVVANWDTGYPGYRGRIDPSVPTLADRLRAAGYSTMAVGKWHLAPPEETTVAGPYDHWPLRRGFDRFYGFLDGATDHFSPDLVLDNTRIDPPRRPGYHLTEDLTSQADTFIRQHRSVHPEKPFFLYLAYGTAHYPLQAPAEYLERYRGRFDAGWDAVRAQRYQRQLDLGVIPPGTLLPPRNADVAAWDSLPRDHQRLAARLQEAYAAMLEHTDAQLGRIVTTLTEVGAYDDTLIVLLSDNGAALEGGTLGSLNFLRKVNGLDPIDLAADLDRLDEIGGPTTSPSYPAGWAMVSNTPLKRYKQQTHGGGIRDPLIISWPNGLAARGEIRRQFAHAIDIAPTVLDLAGIDVSSGAPTDDRQAGRGGRGAMDGASLAPVLRERTAPSPRDTQYFEMLGNRGIWHDGWKAVTHHSQNVPFENDRWELYHLDEDFSEAIDRAGTDPERLDELVALWWKEAERNHVLPLDDRILDRFLIEKPHAITGRDVFTYYGPVHVPTEGMPDIRNVSYRIVAELDVAPGDEGVIVACGDRFGGYALFVQHGRLVHDYNAAGRHFVVESTEPVPSGSVRLAYEFTKTADLAGTARLHIGDRIVGECDISLTLARRITPVGMTIGSNTLSPVSTRYEAPYPFTGRIRTVRFTIGHDRSGVDPAPLQD